MFLFPPPLAPNFRVPQIKAANKPSTTAKLELTVIRGLEEPDFGFCSVSDPSLVPATGIRVGKARSADGFVPSDVVFPDSLLVVGPTDGIRRVPDVC